MAISLGDALSISVVRLLRQSIVAFNALVIVMMLGGSAGPTMVICQRACVKYKV